MASLLTFPYERKTEQNQNPGQRRQAISPGCHLARSDTLMSASDIITVFAEDLPFFSLEHRALVRLLVETGRAVIKDSSEKQENTA